MLNSELVDCICRDGFFENGITCDPCAKKCATCIHSRDNCVTCREERDIIPTCECLTGKYANADLGTCEVCDV